MAVGHLEPLSAVLRIGGAYGEPYTYAVPIRYLSPTTVEVLGAVRAPTPSEWRAVQEVLRAAGVTHFRIARHVRGQWKVHLVSTERRAT